MCMTSVTRIWPLPAHPPSSIVLEGEAGPLARAPFLVRAVTLLCDRTLALPFIHWSEKQAEKVKAVPFRQKILHAARFFLSN